MRIFLVGFMGCGKSYHGREIAEQLNLEFIDLDRYIEEKIGDNISVIFKDKGEDIFRNIEASYLKEVIEKSNIVLATGGGTSAFKNNFSLLKLYGICIYLKVPDNILFERLKKEKAHRPLIAHLNDNELKDFIKVKVKEREFFYLRSDYIINAGQIQSPDILKEIGLS